VLATDDSGQLVVMVGFDGKATFNRLKITEVSSKNSNISFSIQLQLEESKAVFPKEEVFLAVGNPVRSSPLQVISRLNKRKRGSSTNGLNSSGGSAKKRARNDGDPNFVDITSLLV
jgi:hypothetical protein